MKKIVILFAATAAALLLCAAGNEHLKAYVVDYRVNVDGETQEIESKIVNIDGTTYVPLREFADMVGMEVYWNSEEEKVSLFTKAEKEEFPEDNWIAKNVNGKVTYVDKDGSVMLETDYKYRDYKTAEFHNGFAIVSNGKTEGIINAEGEVVIPFGKYRDVDWIYEGMVAVTNEAGTSSPHYGFADLSGNLVIPYKYAWTSHFSEGVCAVSEEDYTECYFIDKTGRKVFGRKTFFSASSFSEGYCVVIVEDKEETKWIPQKFRYIDHTGEFATDEIYDYAMDFSNGTAYVVKDGREMMIDTNFEVVEYLDEE
ncbi:MAG: WG repeat-containing protein [Clostridia bacterium]|nr:WG repeat-containing protein [Clostridia bacterium]